MAPVHDTVELADPPAETVALLGFRLQERLVELVVTVRATVPVNELMLDTVTIVVAGLVDLTVDGFSVIEKSCTMKVTVVL